MTGLFNDFNLNTDLAKRLLKLKYGLAAKCFSQKSRFYWDVFKIGQTGFQKVKNDYAIGREKFCLKIQQM